MLTAPKYIKELRFWTPASLFQNGEAGFWFDPSQLGSMRTTNVTSGGTNAYLNGDTVANCTNLVPDGRNYGQGTAAAMPTLSVSGGLYATAHDTDRIIDASPSTNTMLSACRGWSAVYSVYLNVDGTTRYVLRCDGTAAAPRARLGILATTGVPTLSTRRLEADGSTTISGTTSINNVKGVLSGIVDYTRGTAGVYWNLKTENTGSPTAGVGDTNALTAVGAIGEATNPLLVGSLVYQSVFINRALTTSEWKRTVEYCAQKAGLAI